MNLVRKLSFAKINLGLQVLNKRSDGYHNINTVFYPIKLADLITFKQLPDKTCTITCNVDLKIPVEENLIYKSYEKYVKHNPINFGIEVNLEKLIPFGGGLGGGSSNAANTLLALNDLSENKLNYGELLIIAQTIGSDVPYFLNYGAAIGKSRGENLHYFSYSLPYKMVIVNPNIHVSTPLAYKMLQRDSKEVKEINFPVVLAKALQNPSLLKEHITNDFESVVFKEHKEIKDIKEKLYELGAVFALMSGSGSTVFGLFNDYYDKEKIESTFNNYFVYCE
jgi:4-diphosphocytidyl-2-C-methyl-D-erythritol kinase